MHWASIPQVGVICRLRFGHVYDFSHFYYDEKVAQLNKVHSGSKLFAYAKILCRIMYERVVLLRPVVEVPPRGPWELCMRRWAPVMSRGSAGMVGRYWNTMIEA